MAFIVHEVVYIAPSSTYMVRSLCVHCVVDSKRLAVYRADRIGESGDPGGVLWVIAKGSDEKSPIFSTA